jgi:tyrosyl-tRNA synthetase
MRVNAEIGGHDQLFNMLTGRELMQDILGLEKWVIATRLIEDPNGKKMGKTTGNIVALEDDSAVKIEAFMTWPDSAIALGFELLTRVPLEDVNTAVKNVAESNLHPKDFKSAFALRAVAELDGAEAARAGEEEYDRVYRQGLPPTNIRVTRVEKGASMSEILTQSGLASDIDNAKTLIASGSVLIDGKQARASSKPGQDALVQIGKRAIGKIRRLVLGE